MPIYDELDELREKSWVMVQPRKLRQTIDDLLASLKKLPSQFRSYESYENTKRLLQNYSRVFDKLTLSVINSLFLDECIDF